MTPLLDRDPTPEDLEAERDEPRPGVWAGEDGADLRALTQDETDQLIRAELHAIASAVSATEAEAVRPALGGWEGFSSVRIDMADRKRDITRQRGGIDSDPLVRVLARRAWGDRDRQWFELRGLEQGDQVRIVGSVYTGPRAPGIRNLIDVVAKVWAFEEAIGEALEDGRPGELVRVRWHPGALAQQGNFRNSHGDSARCRVSDRLADAPVGEPSPGDLRRLRATVTHQLAAGKLKPGR